MVSEAGGPRFNRHAYMGNEIPSTQPDLLLSAWYDQAAWQDIGKTPVIQDYPLPTNGNDKFEPDFDDRSTWRDVWLENAIIN